MTPKQIIYPLRYWGSLFKRNPEAHQTRFVEGFTDLLRLPHHCLPLGRARSGLYLLVKAFITEKRNKVLLSPYTVPDVVNMVIFAGGEPVFLDHQPRSTHVDVNILDSYLTEQTACVILTHYHVNQSSICQINDLCQNKGVSLIEDCAISLGGTIRGHSVGTQSSGGVFSLSSYKFLNYLWGGALISSDEVLQKKIESEVEKWKRFRTSDYKSQLVRTLKYDLAMRPVLFDLVTAPLLRRKQRKGAVADTKPPLIESVDFDETLQSRPSAGAFAEWGRKLGDVSNYLTHRRKIASVYDKHLEEFMVSSGTPADIVAGSCFVNYPVWVGEARETVFRELLLSKCDVGRSLYPNAHTHPLFENVEGQSTEVDRLCSSVISLPTHPRVTTEYAESLAKRLKNLL